MNWKKILEAASKIFSFAVEVKADADAKKAEQEKKDQAAKTETKVINLKETP